jgi:hypothetical protein
MEDENDRVNEDLKKKEDRRQQKLLMKNKSVSDRAKAGQADALSVIKKIVTEMPPSVLISAEEKHKSNPFNVRVDVSEIAARMEEVAKADKLSISRRKKQIVKNSDESDNAEDEDDASPSPVIQSPNSREFRITCHESRDSHNRVTSHVALHTSHVTRHTSLVAEGPLLDENGRALPQKAFTMSIGGSQVRCFSCKFFNTSMSF